MKTWMEILKEMKADNKKIEEFIPLWAEQLAGSWDKIADESYDFRFPFDHIENIYASVHKMLAQQLREDARKAYK